MTQQAERRAQGVKRVPVETLVEICGREPGIPAFEAESVEVSDRGLRVRTAYLPEQGAPLVCRFEDRGREILVEGEVAWSQDSGETGEFGIRFTALDAGSVDALRDMCGVPSGEPEPEPEAPPEEIAEEPSPEQLLRRSLRTEGSRVKLHIDGLGSPMKARVRKGNGGRVSVGSNLEFLKVGRSLELENLEVGGTAGAEIDGVTVMVDPQSQVPQLVVSLRYQQPFDETPAPQAEQDDHFASPIPPTHMAAREPSVDPLDDLGPDEDFTESDEDFDEDDGAMFKSKFASKTTDVARTTGAALAKFGASAKVGMGKLFKGAGEKVVELRQQNAEKKKQPVRQRRTTSMPPSGVLSSDGRRLRPQRSQRGAPVQASEPQPVAEESPLKSKKARRIAMIGGGAVLLIAGGVFAMKKPADPPGATAKTGPAEVTVAANQDVTAVDEQGDPIMQPPAASKGKPAAPLAGGDKALDEDPTNATAQVPLFGPTPMATMEPAPLGAPPEAPVDDTPTVADELWGDDKKAEGAGAPEQKADPNSVTPWGRGRVRLPIIHRVRLDAPGGALQGAISPTGFTVIVPGRKAMQSANGIAKRDKRILSVKSANTAQGAQFTFKFRGPIPGYRVRLRKDTVQFLISSPASKVAAR